jgi:very-short-patch-repair endonuclease
MKPIRALWSTRQLVATRQQLMAQGCTSRQLTAAVRSGELVRIRNGYYAAPGLDDGAARAVRIGGRLTCVSAARSFGVWVVDPPFPHVALRHEASRLRSPSNRFVRLDEQNRDGCELHWWPINYDTHSDTHRVSVLDALSHVVRCQPEHLAIAALDSALSIRLIEPWQLEGMFGQLPARFSGLRFRLDERCMSGLETMVRLILERLGLPFDLQVRFDGVGTVDFVVAGCLVIETDGRFGHDDPVSQRRDYDRDLALISRGYSVLRLNFPQVMFREDEVIAGILGALGAHRAFH